MDRLRECLLLCIARFHTLYASARGQTLAEYGLILTLVAVGVTVAALLLFREQLSANFTSAADCIDGC